MLRRKWLILVISVISLIIITVGAGILIVKPFRHIPVPERDPYFTVIISTLAKSGPVVDDMEKRGVYTRIEKDGVLIRENIKVGEIHKLIDEGVYAIIDEGVYAVDEQKYGYVLIFGPNYRPPP